MTPPKASCYTKSHQCHVAAFGRAGIVVKEGVPLTFAQVDPRTGAHRAIRTARGINAFFSAYLEECLTAGYPNGPLEQEAKRIENEMFPTRTLPR